MKAVLLGVVMAMTCALAHAEDMAEMISQYRRAHGLSTVKTDPQLTAIAERQAKAMAASGIMDHSVAGSFSSRMSGARTGMAAENIAAGSSTWAETLRMWKTSPGHNANLLQSKADIVGVAVVRNEQTRYKTYWAMVIAETPPKKKEPKVAAERKTAARHEKAAERHESAGSSENPISAIKNFVCKYLC
jgi:Cysteine-rich secretory protein family